MAPSISPFGTMLLTHLKYTRAICFKTSLLGSSKGKGFFPHPKCHFIYDQGAVSEEKAQVLHTFLYSFLRGCVSQCTFPSATIPVKRHMLTMKWVWAGEDQLLNMATQNDGGDVETSATKLHRQKLRVYTVQNSASRQFCVTIIGAGFSVMYGYWSYCKY